MNTEIIVINNFYNDVDAVRNMALKMSYNVAGNYPGLRTVPHLTTSAQQVIQNIITPHGGKVINWMNDSKNYSGSFQICYKTDKTWIHADIHNKWSGVCYLTPNPIINSGTGFYKHKETQQYYYVDNYHDGNTLDDWQLVDYVENKYNRLVLFRGLLFHKAHDYFGEDINSGRLFQTFFFDTEY
jgi:hypothetical protein